MIDLEELSKTHYRNRVGNCWSDSARWPCRAWRDAETINRLMQVCRRFAAAIRWGSRADVIRALEAWDEAEALTKGQK